MREAGVEEVGGALFSPRAPGRVAVRPGLASRARPLLSPPTRLLRGVGGRHHPRGLILALSSITPTLRAPPPGPPVSQLHPPHRCSAPLLQGHLGAECACLRPLPHFLRPCLTPPALTQLLASSLKPSRLPHQDPSPAHESLIAGQSHSVPLGSSVSVPAGQEADPLRPWGAGEGRLPQE